LEVLVFERDLDVVFALFSLPDERNLILNIDLAQYFNTAVAAR